MLCTHTEFKVTMGFQSQTEYQDVYTVVSYLNIPRSLYKMHASRNWTTIYRGWFNLFTSLDRPVWCPFQCYDFILLLEVDDINLHGCVDL